MRFVATSRGAASLRLSKSGISTSIRRVRAGAHCRGKTDAEGQGGWRTYHGRL